MANRFARRTGVSHTEYQRRPSGYGRIFEQAREGGIKPQLSLPTRSSLMGQERSASVGSLDRCCKRAQRALGRFKSIPTTMRVVFICIAVLAVFSVTNLIYQILHKPTEVFALIPGESNKAPIETWRQYAPLFREYSTASISPELLVALAQVEGAGNPVASTYWRWRLTWNPFDVYLPAASSAGSHQMTDAAVAEARR